MKNVKSSARWLRIPFCGSKIFLLLPTPASSRRVASTASILPATTEVLLTVAADDITTGHCSGGDFYSSDGVCNCRGVDISDCLCIGDSIRSSDRVDNGGRFRSSYGSSCRTPWIVFRKTDAGVATFIERTTHAALFVTLRKGKLVHTSK